MGGGAFADRRQSVLLGESLAEESRAPKFATSVLAGDVAGPPATVLFLRAPERSSWRVYGSTVTLPM